MVSLAAANVYGGVLVAHRPEGNPTIVLPDAVVLPDPFNWHLVGNHYEPLVADEQPTRSPSLVATHGSRSPSTVMPSQDTKRLLLNLHREMNLA